MSRKEATNQMAARDMAQVVEYVLQCISWNNEADAKTYGHPYNLILV
jgi:hypothetical protein